jgi:hypothetical protein
MAAPATPYIVTAAILFSVEGNNNNQFGLVHRQSSDGKIETFGYVTSSPAQMMAQTYSNPTTFNSTLKNVQWLAPNVLWLRMQDNGTSRIYSISPDGQHWRVFHTVGRTVYLTADQIGWYVSTNSATISAAATLLSWKVE